MISERTCRRCLYSTSHPLGLVIDGDGVCSGCRIHEEKDRLDWKERWRRLERLVASYRSSSGAHDCIIPVSGTPESYFIVDTVKRRLGLNPLLVHYNRYFNTPVGIWNLANLRIRFDCDLVSQNINPRVVRRICASTLRQFGSVYWHCIAGTTVFPVQTAVRTGIPLIIWGAHQGLEQVGMFSHEHEVEMTRRHRKDHDLMGLEADDLLSTFDTLTADDIWQYRYPDDSALHRVGVRGIYLGNYLRWDPRSQNESMVRQYGCRSAGVSGSFDPFEHIDCFVYMGVHDALKLAKCGYSRVTDHACREIRHGRLGRAAARSLVLERESRLLGEIPHFRQFCDWLGVTTGSLELLIDLHRSRRHWLQAGPRSFRFHGVSSRDSGPLAAHAEVLAYEGGYAPTHPLGLGDGDRYVVVGKGHP